MGLDEETRKLVYYKLLHAEHSASTAAAREYPNGADWEKAYELEERLLANDRFELAKKYGYKEDDWGKIAVEGITKGWPTPPR